MRALRMSRQTGCGVAFIIKGEQEEVGAVGVVGVGINDDSRWLLQNLLGGRGYRMMVVLENAQAGTSHTVNLELDQNISVVNIANGGAVFVNKDNLVIGSILEPWALDANGQKVPVTQTITKTSITITVDTTNVTAWPVIADPEYHTFRCYSHHQVTTLGTTLQYLNGHKCPRYTDIIARGYYSNRRAHFRLQCWAAAKAAHIAVKPRLWWRW